MELYEIMCVKLENCKAGTSLVAQWLRICLPMQGAWVQSLVLEDPTCHGATNPVCHNYWACTLEPASHNYWAHMPQLLKPTHSRAHVLQLLKPACSRAHMPQLMSPCTTTTEACASRACAPQQEKPLQMRSPCTATREHPCAATKTQRSQKKEKRKL